MILTNKSLEIFPSLARLVRYAWVLSLGSLSGIHGSINDIGSTAFFRGFALAAILNSRLRCLWIFFRWLRLCQLLLTTPSSTTACCCGVNFIRSTLTVGVNAESVCGGFSSCLAQPTSSFDGDSIERLSSNWRTSIYLTKLDMFEMIAGFGCSCSGCGASKAVPFCGHTTSAPVSPDVYLFTHAQNRNSVHHSFIIHLGLFQMPPSRFYGPFKLEEDTICRDLPQLQRRILRAGRSSINSDLLLDLGARVQWYSADWGGWYPSTTGPKAWSSHYSDNFGFSWTRSPRPWLICIFNHFHREECLLCWNNVFNGFRFQRFLTNPRHFQKSLFECSC